MNGHTLNRIEALGLIEGYEAAGELRTLTLCWIGHDNAETPEEELGDLLAEYVSECALSDDVRSNGPHDTDETGLIDPEEL